MNTIVYEETLTGRPHDTSVQKAISDNEMWMQFNVMWMQFNVMPRTLNHRCGWTFLPSQVLATIYGVCIVCVRVCVYCFVKYLISWPILVTRLLFLISNCHGHYKPQLIPIMPHRLFYTHDERHNTSGPLETPFFQTVGIHWNCICSAPNMLRVTLQNVKLLITIPHFLLICIWTKCQDFHIHETYES